MVQDGLRKENRTPVGSLADDLGKKLGGREEKRALNTKR